MNTIQSILIIVTSFSELVTGEPTGLWLEEFVVPYMEFQNQGMKVTVASIEGGKAPVDPRSNPDEVQAKDWQQAIKVLENTVAIKGVKAAEFDAVYIPGGHGTMFDLPDNQALQAVLQDFAQQDKVIAAMCHGPAALVGVTLKDGTPLVAGRMVTGFTNSEEAAAGFVEKMPFLLEDRLTALGAKFIGKDNWATHVEIDGQLITGQNPQSSKATALAVVEALRSRSGER